MEPRLTIFPFFYRATLCVSAVFAVARCLSVCLSRSCIPSRWMKISSNFFVGPGIAHHSSFLTLGADTQFQREPLHLGRKIHGGGKMLRYSTEIAVYLGNCTRFTFTFSALSYSGGFFKSLSYLYEVVRTNFSADFLDFSQFLTAISRTLWCHLATKIRIV